MAKKEKMYWWQPASAALLILILLISVDYIYHRNRVYAGVFVDGVDLSGKNITEACELLEKHYLGNSFFSRKINLTYKGESWPATYGEVGIAPDYERTADKAVAAGKNSLHIFRYPQRIAMRRAPVHLQPALAVDPVTFRYGVAITAETVREEPVNAELSLSSDRKHVKIVADKPGLELDFEATLARLKAALDMYPDIPDVEIASKQVEAAVTANYLESLDISEPISTFSTLFSNKDADRNHNIRLASGAIDNLILFPGSQFSFNETVGNTTEEKGYRKAPIILDGSLEEGLGGGICQVSSTLYNAVLLADLKIVERRNHGLVVGYLPPGRDATISYGWIDLKFLNDRDHAIWLKTFIDGNRLTATLYGSPIEGHDVKIVTTDLTTIPYKEKIVLTPELPKGVREELKKGQPGYKITVWRVTTMNGQEVKREKISQDSYKAVPAEYQVGTAEVPASAEPGDPAGSNQDNTGAPQENEGEAAN